MLGQSAATSLISAGGIMTKRKDSSVTVAIITAVSAVTIAVIGGVFTLLQRQPVQTSPDNSSGSSNLPLASQATPTASAEQIVFTLKDSRPEDYYVLDKANFVLRQDGKLALMGSYAQGTYINRPLPANFRAIVQFQTQHPEDQFILGLSDGRKMRPNYHFVMVPWGPVEVLNGSSTMRLKTGTTTFKISRIQNPFGPISLMK